MSAFDDAKKRASEANRNAKQIIRDAGFKLPEDLTDSEFMKENETTIPKKEKK